jgi:hypothetical protein
MKALALTVTLAVASIASASDASSIAGYDCEGMVKLEIQDGKVTLLGPYLPYLSKVKIVDEKSGRCVPHGTGGKVFQSGDDRDNLRHFWYYRIQDDAIKNQPAQISIEESSEVQEVPIPEGIEESSGDTGDDEGSSGDTGDDKGCSFQHYICEKYQPGD